jgi:hypothetical protein
LLLLLSSFRRGRGRIEMAASTNPAVLGSLMPGANISGSSVAVPPTPLTSYGTQAVGGNVNPFLPTTTTGQATPPLTSPTATTSSATPTTSGATASLGGSNIYSGLFGGGQNKQGIIKGLEKTGIPGGIAALLAEFMMSGSGFNPQVAQALIDAMGPSIERGKEGIMEQFSAMGNRFGSPAAVGLGDYMSQVNLNIGEIFSQLYEQSVSNYLSILMGAGKKAPTFGSTFSQSLAGGLGSGLGALATGG